PLLPDLLAAHHLAGDVLVLLGDRLGATGEGGGGDHVGGQVLQFTRKVLGLRRDAGGLDRLGEHGVPEHRDLLEAGPAAVTPPSPPASPSSPSPFLALKRSKR